MPLIPISRLTTVPVRTVLPNEERDFTPWLVENLDLLAKVVGGGLELVDRERRVGAFEADLVLRMTGETDFVVVVENQYGISDHDHLGKLLTYCAGVEASIAILIAERIREEHRLALERLNDAGTALRFWGVEFGFVRIGDSAVAPELRAVVRPAEALAQVAKASRRTSSPLTDEVSAATRDLLEAAAAEALVIMPDRGAWKIDVRARNGFAWLMPPDFADPWFTLYVSVKGVVGAFSRTREAEGLALFDELELAQDGAGLIWQRGQDKATVECNAKLDWRSPAGRSEAVGLLARQFAAVAPLVCAAKRRKIRENDPAAAAPPASSIYGVI